MEHDFKMYTGTEFKNWLLDLACAQEVKACLIAPEGIARNFAKHGYRLCRDIYGNVFRPEAS